MPTKVGIVKAMVFPVVMYVCEIWTIKKAEHQRIDTFELCWRRFLRVPWSARRSNQSVPKESESRSIVFDSLWAHGRLLHPWDFPGMDTGMDCHFLLQGIFLTQGSNLGLPHCRHTLYHLSHQGSPSETETHSVVSNSLWLDYMVQGILLARMLKWVAFPFSRRSSKLGKVQVKALNCQPGIEPRFPALQVDSLAVEPQGKPKNIGVGSLFLLQWIFLTQELN